MTECVRTAERKIHTATIGWLVACLLAKKKKEEREEREKKEKKSKRKIDVSHVAQ